MADTRCVADPMSEAERLVLRAYVERDVDWLASPDPMGVQQAATEMLVSRGFLQRHERGMLVTPEGVAAALS